MAKSKTVFFCKNCGAESPKWVGRCNACGEWNTYQEEVVQKGGKKNFTTQSKEKTAQPLAIQDISYTDEVRKNTFNNELNRVLGGGIVAGSLVLIGGEPGIGKSTLMLQVALQMKNAKILYISGEESQQQIRMRADRIGKCESECLILTETLTQNIFRQIETLQPNLVIIDSIQTLQTEHLDSSAGSISQIRECSAELLQYAKQTSTPVILIGHITKDGNLAGPKILEHMVDTVLYFEGDRNYGYRILRCIKNRFGSTSEIGIFEMLGNGLREISNPSEILISHRDVAVSGVSVAATIEGIRPLLIEIQALVGSAAYGTPQRSSTGFDAKRMNMLLAVLEKRCGFRLGAKDVFLNVAGGFRVDDPAVDLAVMCAVLSSSEDIPIQSDICFAAEVGLSGEIRAVSRVEQRISEAEKLGFKKIFVSKYNLKSIKKSKIEQIPITKIEEIFSYLFG